MIPTGLTEWAGALGLPEPGELAVLLMTCLGSPGPFDGDALEPRPGATALTINLSRS